MLSALSAYLLALQRPLIGAITELLAIPLLHLKNWIDSATNLPSLPRLPKFPSATIGAIIRGLLITIPLALVVIILLGNADPIFGKLTENLLKSITPNISLLHRLVGSLLIIVITAPIAFMSIKDTFRSPLADPKLHKYHIEVAIAVGTIAVILAGFLLVQFRYIFATVPEADLHQFGIPTYSAYVRKGFIELLLVSTIVYCTIGLSLVVYRVSRLPWLKTLNLILLAETTIFIVSIFRRVALYQQHHGLTRIRIYGTAFVIMMLALTITLTLRHLIKRRFSWYVLETAIVIATILATIGLNPDHLIASKFPPTVNNEIDYVYISRLSATAADSWVTSYAWAKAAIESYDASPNLNNARHLQYAGYILKNIQIRSQKLTTKKDWYSTNLAEKAAHQTLADNISPDELQRLINYVQDINMNMPESLRQPLDRSPSSPLVD